MRIFVFLLTAIFFLCLSSPVSSQTFLWNQTIRSEGFDEVYDLAADPSGNVYVTGMIEYLADFGNGVVLEARGVHDIFIAKYDSSGNLIWARRDGGRDGDKAHSIALDGQGFLYVAGEFEDTSYWGPFMKIADGGNNMFVAKYDTSGNVLWVESIGTTTGANTRAYGVGVDASSNVYVAGGTQGDTYYNGAFLFTSTGDYDGMLVSFDKFGNFRWAKRMGGNDSDKARAVVSDQGSNIYLTGYYSGNANFSGTNLPGQGHTDIFLAKYDTTGLLQWVTQAGDTGFDRSWDIDININGQILVAGDESRGHFDANVASCQGMTDAFVAAYDDSGNNLWVVAGGGPEADQGKGVTHDNAGNIYLTGDFGGSAIFPPFSYSSNNYAEPFMVSYTSDGTTLRWARVGVGPSNDRGIAIGVDNAGSIYSTGNFDDSIQFGQMVLQGDSLYDIYITKLSAQNICYSSASLSGAIDCYGMCNGTATAIAGGQSPFSYSWNTVPVQQSQTATGLCAGTYTVTVTDFSGCTSTASITLTDPPELIVAAASTPVTCAGGCDGSATAIATGQAPFSYSWNTVPVQATAIATGLCAGNYTVTVTDSAGCLANASVTLNDPAALTVTANSTAITCFNFCDGTAGAAAAGQSPFSYSWNTVPVQLTDTATGLCAGNYTVTVTDAAGCTAAYTVTLNNPPQLIVNPAVTAASCYGSCDGIANAITVGQGPFTFSWNTVPVQNTQAATGLCAGNYAVTVTDSAGCIATAPVLVSQPFALTITGSVSDATCAGCTDGAIDISPAGGTAGYQYLWSNGETTEDLNGLPAGTYSVCVTDANLCQQCDTFLVLEPSTGISGFSMLEFSVYPNPFSSVTTIRLHENSSQSTTLFLYNSIGELVYSTVFTGRDFALDASGRNPGVYFLSLRNNQSQRMIPLVIE